MSKNGPLVLRVDELAAAMEGRLASGRRDATITGFTIDSRRVSPGDLFFAVRGERFDGHDFAADALDKGAVGVIVTDASAVVSGARGQMTPITIVVGDTTEALQLLARFVRRRSGARVVAITGSVGKTTTKELTAAFVSTRYRVFCNEGNLNNHIGLPLSLLELRHRPEVAVVEFGMSHAGEIRKLVRITEPEVRVWTNVAQAHAAFFESIEAIADAKAEILEEATTGTQLVANAADPRVMARIGGFVGKVSTFGVDTEADVCATGVRNLGLDGTESSIRTPGRAGALRTALLGEGNIANVLAAIAVAVEFQVPLDVMLKKAAMFAPPPRRGEIVRLAGGITVVDDSYNSSPTALDNVLRSVARETQCARRVAVLGEMLELGARSADLHRECGRAAVEGGFTVVIAVGGLAAEALAAGAREAGPSSNSVVTCPTSEVAAEVTSRVVEPGDVVLVKGSRGMRTELVVDRLKAECA